MSLWWLLLWARRRTDWLGAAIAAPIAIALAYDEVRSGRAWDIANAFVIAALMALSASLFTCVRSRMTGNRLAPSTPAAIGNVVLSASVLVLVRHIVADLILIWGANLATSVWCLRRAIMADRAASASTRARRGIEPWNPD